MPSLRSARRFDYLPEAWDPARDALEILFIRCAKFAFQVWLFIVSNEGIKDKENGNRINQQIPVSKPQKMTQDNCQHTHIHWIANITIKTCRHQFLGRVDGCRRATSLDKEIPERP